MAVFFGAAAAAIKLDAEMLLAEPSSDQFK